MKAIALFSGGLDSILAVKLIQKQNIDVAAISFISPFFGNKKQLKDIAKKNKINLKIIDITKDYIKLVKNPEFGYGKHMNPCIDCKILMLKKAKLHAKKINAKFILTGEVLGQRPMSQREQTLRQIETKAGLKEKLLRPLSAKNLSPTAAEINKLIDRNRLLSIKGRTRKEQLRLAKKYKIKKYISAGGGCLLTYKGYANKLRDLFKHKKRITKQDIKILKTGRHFKKNKNKIIVGRNKEDNKQLLKLKALSDYKFEAKKMMGPITILKGRKTKDKIKLAAELTARYSDADSFPVKIKYGKAKFNKEITVKSVNKEKLKKLMV